MSTKSYPRFLSAINVYCGENGYARISEGEWAEIVDRAHMRQDKIAAIKALRTASTHTFENPLHIPNCIGSPDSSKVREFLLRQYPYIRVTKNMGLKEAKDWLDLFMCEPTLLGDDGE